MVLFGPPKNVYSPALRYAARAVYSRTVVTRIDGATAREDLGGALAAVGAIDLGGRSLDAGVDAAPGPGWLSRDDVLDDAVLADLLARTARCARDDGRRVTATWLLESYAGGLAGAAWACLAVGGVLPRVEAADVRLRFGDDGAVTGLRVVGGRTLRAPAGRAHPRALLMTALRRDLVEHLGPVVERLMRAGGRGRRAMWACVEDAAVGYMHWLGERAGVRETAEADAALLIGHEPPLAGAARFAAHADHAGEIRRLRLRNGCCLSFTRACADGRACVTCPRTTDDERRRRLASP